MDENPERPLAVDEVVEYCQTQAALLSGRVQEMTREAEGLLDDIDEETAALRAELDSQREGVAGTATPQSAGDAVESDDLGAIEEREADLEATQNRVDALQARVGAYQDLTSAYTDLAATLHSEVSEGGEALERVVQFEADRDAPAYFPDRRTLLETAVESSDAGPK